MEKFAARVAALVVQRPLSIVLLASVVFVFFAIQVPRVVIDNSVDNMLPADDPVVLAGNRSDAEFGSGSSILVAIRSTNVLAPAFLQKLAGLTHTLDRLDAKILADKRPEMIREVSRIIGLSGDDGKKAAGYFNFLTQNRLWVYNTGWNPEFGKVSPGWVLLVKMIQWAIENGLEEVDLMRGDEEYKYRFGAQDREVVQVLIGLPQ